MLDAVGFETLPRAAKAVELRIGIPVVLDALLVSDHVAVWLAVAEQISENPLVACPGSERESD